MSCRDLIPKLEQFVFGELTEREEQEVETHLANCKTCSLEVAALRKWKHLIHGAGQRFTPSPQFRSRMKKEYGTGTASRGNEPGKE